MSGYKPYLTNQFLKVELDLKSTFFLFDIKTYYNKIVGLIR